MQPPFWLNAAPPIQEFGSTGMGRGAAFSQKEGCIYQFPCLILLNYKLSKHHPPLGASVICHSVTEGSKHMGKRVDNTTNSEQQAQLPIYKRLQDTKQDSITPTLASTLQRASCPKRSSVQTSHY